MIKLVATDIDGTILIPEGDFTNTKIIEGKVNNVLKRFVQKGLK